MQGLPVWQLLQFLLNSTLFVLVGLQLPVAASALKDHSSWELAGYAAAIWVAVIGIRLLWGFTVVYLIRGLDRRASQRERRSGWRERVIVALDVPDLAALESFLDRLEGQPAFYKVGLELYLAEGARAIDAVRKRNGRIFLDLKLHDIPATVAGAARAVARSLDICWTFGM